MKRLRRYINIISKLRLSGMYFLGINKLNQLKLVHGILSISVPGIKYRIFLRAGTSDFKLFENIFIEEEYKISLPFIPETIIDGGANIGLAAIKFANNYPNAKIISVEPEASNYEMLQRNVARYQNISLINGGIWHNSSFLNITNPNAGKWAFIISETDTPDQNSIKGISLDDIISGSGWKCADVIKLDIEGSEKEVFDHCGAWLNNAKALIVETHDWFKPDSSTSVFKAINNHDFTTSYSGENMVLMRNR